MSQTQLRLFLITLVLVVNHVCSWDVAITAGKKLEFHDKGNKLRTVGPFSELGGVTYDPIHDKVFFVESSSETTSIHSYHVGTEKSETIVSNAYAFIHDLAFDPITERIFWTDSRIPGVYWKSSRVTEDDYYGNILVDDFKKDELPLAIAVDSCRGYIYWTNWAINRPGTIRRVRIDGSEKQTIADDLEFPNGLIIDQQTKKLYWLDTTIDEHYTIYSSDLEGGTRQILLSGYKNAPIALTVSKNSLYWVDSWPKHIWQFVKKPYKGVDAGQFAAIYKKWHKANSITANYDINDQTEGIAECGMLRNLGTKKFCDQGMKVFGRLACECSPGYIGERCEISVCDVYCANGDCRITTDGTPECIFECESDEEGCSAEVSYSNANQLRSIHFLYILALFNFLRVY